MGLRRLGGKSLLARFLRLYVPLVLLAIIVIEGGTSLREIVVMKEQLDRKLSRLLASQSIILAQPVWKRDRARIRMVVASTVADPEVVGIVVRDDRGQVLDDFGTFSGSNVMATRLSGINYVASADVERVGELEIAVTDRRIFELVGERLLTQSAAALFILASAIVCAYLAYVSAIGTPLKRLLAAVDRSRPIDQPARRGWAEDDEMGGLVSGYNALLARTDNATRALTAAKDQAEAASLAKSAFLAQMSHELRTPLNSIIGFAEMMTQEYFGTHGDPRYKQYSRDIRGSASHLLMVINDILDIAKIEAGELEIDERSVGACEIAGAAMTMVETDAKEAGVALHRELPAGLPRLLGDERLIRQILLNLLSNAVKFTPRDGEVKISAALRDDGGLQFAIADTGVGIAAEDMETVHAPFGQLRSSAHHTHPGTGLGVPIARHFCELHGGRLEFESVVGQGTTVTAIFPASRARQAPIPRTA